METDDIYELKITDTAYGDYSVGRLNNFVIFVDNYAMPEDVVKVKITDLKKNYAFGELIEIIQDSPYRIKNQLCPSFENGCGGCQWLNAQYKMQLAWKKKNICDSFKKIGKFETGINDVTGMEDPFFYRNKMTVHCSNNRAGFYKKRSYDIVDVGKCRQQMEFNQNVFDGIDKKYYQHINNFQIKCSKEGKTLLKINTADSSKNEKFLSEIKKINTDNLIINKDVISGNSYIEQKIKNFIFRIPADGFFQVNYFIAEKLIDHIVNYISLNKNENVIDLYCGVGLFSLFISQFCNKVLAADNNKEAIESAYVNASQNKIDNVSFKKSDAAYALKKFQNEKFNTVILDPPRTGCDKEVLLEIVKLRVKRVIYVSCAPDTLARDLSLLKLNGYNIINCQPFDMFPHTYHVETVVILEF